MIEKERADKFGNANSQRHFFSKSFENSQVVKKTPVPALAAAPAPAPPMERGHLLQGSCRASLSQVSRARFLGPRDRELQQGGVLAGHGREDKGLHQTCVLAGDPFCRHGAIMGLLAHCTLTRASSSLRGSFCTHNDDMFTHVAAHQAATVSPWAPPGCKRTLRSLRLAARCRPAARRWMLVRSARAGRGLLAAVACSWVVAGTGASWKTLMGAAARELARSEASWKTLMGSNSSVLTSTLPPVHPVSARWAAVAAAAGRWVGGSHCRASRAK